VRRLLPIVLFLGTSTFGQNTRKLPAHPDYVPDERTAERIAELVLIAQFGHDRVNAQLPLQATSTSRDTWLVQGLLKDKEGRTQVGGSYGVWINKHDGCLKVIERMK